MFRCCVTATSASVLLLITAGSQSETTTVAFVAKICLRDMLQGDFAVNPWIKIFIIGFVKMGSKHETSSPRKVSQDIKAEFQRVCIKNVDLQRLVINLFP